MRQNTYLKHKNIHSRGSLRDRMFELIIHIN